MLNDRFGELHNHGQDRTEILCSPVDGGYVSADGKLTCIEVITCNYTQSEVEAKTEFVEGLGAEYQPYYI